MDGFGLDLTGVRQNKEMTDTGAEKLWSGGPWALMRTHWQPGNSVHLLYTVEWGGSFIAYSWKIRKGLLWHIHLNEEEGLLYTDEWGRDYHIPLNEEGWLVSVGSLHSETVSGYVLQEEEAVADTFCTHCQHPYLVLGKALLLPWTEASESLTWMPSSNSAASLRISWAPHNVHCFLP